MYAYNPSVLDVVGLTVDQRIIFLRKINVYFSANGWRQSKRFSGDGELVTVTASLEGQALPFVAGWLTSDH